MAKRQKNRQSNGQKTEEQTKQWPKDRRTDNTMAKRQKNRQSNGQKTEEQTKQWPKEKIHKMHKRNMPHAEKSYRSGWKTGMRLIKEMVFYGENILQ
jgi:hypothetical protein